MVSKPNRVYFFVRSDSSPRLCRLRLDVVALHLSYLLLDRRTGCHSLALKHLAAGTLSTRQSFFFRFSLSYCCSLSMHLSSADDEACCYVFLKNEEGETLRCVMPYWTSFVCNTKHRYLSLLLFSVVPLDSSCLLVFSSSPIQLFAFFFSLGTFCCTSQLWPLPLYGPLAL